MKEILEFIITLCNEAVSQGFFYFLGYFLVMLIIINIPIRILTLLLRFFINRPLRHWNIRKHGYPPEHCDADGDFKHEPEPKKNEDTLN
jgi:hypothetical protein